MTTQEQEQIKRKIEEQNKKTREDKRGYAERLTDRINREVKRK